MYLKIRKFSCVRAHIGNLINYMRTDTKDLLTNRFGGNGIKTVRLCSESKTIVCGELRTFDGGLPLDLRIHEPCSRYGGRQGKQEVANRG